MPRARIRRWERRIFVAATIEPSKERHVVGERTVLTKLQGYILVREAGDGLLSRVRADMKKQDVMGGSGRRQTSVCEVVALRPAGCVLRRWTSSSIYIEQRNRTKRTRKEIDVRAAPVAGTTIS